MSKARTEPLKAPEVTEQTVGCQLSQGLCAADGAVCENVNACRTMQTARQGRERLPRKEGDGRAPPASPCLTLPPEGQASWCFTLHETGAHHFCHGCSHGAGCSSTCSRAHTHANEAMDRLSKRKSTSQSSPLARVHSDPGVSLILAVDECLAVTEKILILCEIPPLKCYNQRTLKCFTALLYTATSNPIITLTL